MSVRSLAAQAATVVLGTGAVDAVARRRWASSLRVIDYHEISDVAAFEAQIELVARRYRPVGEHQVIEALGGGEPLPDHAVWLTFDDGHPSVIEKAVPVLARHGMRATFYVCPGLVETGTPPWWEVVSAAGRVGVGAEVGGRHLVGGELVRALKLRPDAERRAVVADLSPVGEAELEPGAFRVSVEGLERWIDAGHTLGNHTWDHPCLDRCTDAEQREQIVRSDAWLRDRFQGAATFAYPNGDHTPHAEAILAELGYSIGQLSDHALVDPEAPALQMSRLRLDASASRRRARAVLSGAHSAGYRWALRRQLTGPAVRGR